jgi:hypothetical protein
MPNFLVVFALVFTGSIGMFGVANAETTNTALIFSYHNGQATNINKNSVSANDYYFQSWNCLTNF